MYKLSSLQAARGLAALMVVAFHSLFISAKYVESKSFPPEIFFFGQTGVDLFFVISGFVMIIAFRNKFGKKGEISNFLKGRFFRIYPTYWVYFFAVFIIFQIRPEMMNSSQSGNIDLTASLLLLPASTLPLLMVAWSLIHEVWFYLIFAVILLLPPKWVLSAFSFWLIAIIYASLFTATPENPYLRVMTHAFSLEFIFGALAGIAYLKLSKRPASSPLAVALMALTGLGAIAYSLSAGTVNGSDVIQSISLERAFAVGGGYTLLLLAFALQESNNRLKVFSFLKLTGDMSYSLYLSHILTLSVCGRVWLSLGLTGSGAWGTIVFWAASYSAVILVAYLSYRLIEKPLLTLTDLYKKPKFIKQASPAKGDT
ncbi:MAG: acyltransferase family protein [Pseudomonas sp.]|uniref:acyltransferase family protein n=1 Tax=Pseudomonas sp. TaxID=306 RepID=UPI003D0F92B3